ncbi:MAG: hypothetical protein ACTSRB_08715 [Candidatus Helarchaeota archaeon]
MFLASRIQSSILTSYWLDFDDKFFLHDSRKPSNLEGSPFWAEDLPPSPAPAALVG